MPRLGHKKSRLGCRQCKSRHVKCDELKPCTNCARHSVPCSLITDQPPSAPSVAASSSGSAPKRSKSTTERSKAGSSSSPSLNLDYVLNPSAKSPGDGVSEGSSPSSLSDHFPFLKPFIHKPKPDQSNLWVRDIELMHHWTIEAYDELSQREDMRFTWRVEAPKVATTYPFLMHEILAFAAFHKVSQIPDRRLEYYTLGIHHQDLAIKGMRPKLQNITPEEAPAIVATSTLLTLSVFASTGFEATYGEETSTTSAIDGILNIFTLMQGMGNVLALAHAHLTDSFLAPMFRDPLEATPSQPLLQELLNHLPILASFVETKEDLSEQERALFNGVITHFEPVLKLASPPRVDNRELRFLFFWPLHLDGNFLASVRQRHSAALVILMYYATMLFSAEPRYWFMAGWGHRLMKACYDQVDDTWLPVLQWPSSFLETGSMWSLFKDMSQATSVGGGQLQDQPRLPYAQQPPQTLAFHHNPKPPSKMAEQKPVSTLDRSRPYPHLTGQMPPSYAPQAMSASYLPPVQDTEQSQPSESYYNEHVQYQSNEADVTQAHRQKGQGS